MITGIAGASGLIGYNFYKTLKKHGAQTLGTYSSTRKRGLARFDLRTGRFSLFDKCGKVIVAASITDIDQCRLRKKEAYKINVERTIALIAYLADKKIQPVFLSSDQVFDGKKGDYTEKDNPNPLNYYGEFKLEVEEFIRANLKDYLILRLSKTYSRNLRELGMFSEIFLKLKHGQRIKAAYNQIFNPTDVSMVCRLMRRAIKKDLKGLFHLASPAAMSRYDFALALAREEGFDPGLIEPADIRRLGLAEKRPLDTSLNVKKMNAVILS